MSPLDIAIIVVVSVAFVAAVGAIIYRKVRKKGGCGCGCSGCPHSSGCCGSDLRRPPRPLILSFISVRYAVKSYISAHKSKIIRIRLQKYAAMCIIKW